ncbi:hypothetical protein Q7P37_004364 [Cladosporium fusiforme]
MTETTSSTEATPMADVVSPPATSATSPSANPIPFTTSPETIAIIAPQPEAANGRVPPLDRSRLSTVSHQRPSSRPHSSVFAAFHSSLQYAIVRDFAYPPFHPMHYGAPPEPPSGATTPGSEFSQSRRLSDPQDNSWSSSGRAGPWGGDGYLYPEQGANFEALPSTSFGDEGDDDDPLTMRRRSRHRQSRSLNNISEWERGRMRESTGRDSNDGMFLFNTSQLDPAGTESLRHSRGFAKRDSHFAATLSSRAFHNSNQQTNDSTPTTRTGEDEDLIPLDSEASTHAQSPQRASMGPEDELFAGESLALYAFEPENNNELRLYEGQIILVSYRHGQGWLVAEDPATGEQGLVPEEYVRLVRDIEGWDTERGAFIDQDGEADLDESDEQVTQSGTSSIPGHLQHDDDDLDSGNSSEAVTGRPSRAMLAEPPDVDHEEGLSMNVSLSPINRKGAGFHLEGEDDERRQDSGHAEK